MSLSPPRGCGDATGFTELTSPSDVSARDSCSGRQSLAVGVAKARAWGGGQLSLILSWGWPLDSEGTGGPP